MASEQSSYFVPLGEDRYQPTEHSGGTWRDDELHLAPVGGLLVHHMERWREANADASLVFSRITIEVLGQIMREPIELSTEVIRPGRTIEQIEATAVIAGRPTLRARAWLLQSSGTSDVAGHEYEPMPQPDAFTRPSMLLDWPGGFIRTLRAVDSDDTRAGRGRTWVTSDLELVRGEPSTPLADFSKLLDTSNGVAVRENPKEWMFPNVDLSLHFFRQPSGRWLGLDKRASFGTGGIGLTSSVMHDLQGPVGVINQSLTLRRLN